MSGIPNDPMMLLSFVNTQLRDNYDTLEEFCEAYEVCASEIISKLSKIDYEYNESLNKFI